MISEMIQKYINFILLIAFTSMVSISFAEGNNHDDHAGHGHEKTEAHATEAAHGDETHGNDFDPVEMIMHHIGDANEFHIIGNENTSINWTMPLPIILLDKEEGLKVFMSSKFDHGHTAVDGYVLDHGVVRKVVGDFPSGEQTVAVHHGEVVANGEHFATESKMTLLHWFNDESEVDPSFYDFSFTKIAFGMFLSVIILLFIFIGMGSFYKKGNMVPKGIYSALEPFILYIRNDIAIENIGEKKADKFLPLLLTIFFFIWINNLMGLIPIFPFSANVTGNIAFTFVLSLVILLVVNLSANKDYWMHMLWMPGVPTPMKLVMAPIELVGIITKPFALMMRLFANITAGHILILSLVSLIFIFDSIGMSAVSVPFMLFMNVLELLVAFLQAYIFTLLAALFIGMAVAEHEHH